MNRTQSRTYRAVQATSPGVLELIERPVPVPGVSQVLVAVEACGICGADAGAIEGTERGSRFPRVPGHEVIGRIAALGTHVATRWSVGQRVGVGRLGGACGACDACRSGCFQLCTDQPVVGSSQDGGYAEMMLVRDSGLVSIPDELSAEEAAPILCAGIATFNALKKCGAEPGDLVIVQGIGGLGHLALQYARKMGFKVVALGRGRDIEAQALALGAHVYIDSRAPDALDRLRALGGAQAILSTITDSAAASELATVLAPQGRLMILGVGREPYTLLPGLMVGGEREVHGSLTGTPRETEKVLRFSVLVDARPAVEMMPLEHAAEAYQRMRKGEAQFRMVLTMGAPR